MSLEELNMTETDFVQTLKQGRQDSFVVLVKCLHGSMVRVATTHVRDSQAAEEIVQETWTAIIKGIHGFEGRSKLKTWMYSILLNQTRNAQRRAARWKMEEFNETNYFDEKGSWKKPPKVWKISPEDEVRQEQARAHLRSAIEALPDKLKDVVVLKDVEGLDSKEVCDLLEISEGNLRVMLHRGRMLLRDALEEFADGV